MILVATRHAAHQFNRRMGRNLAEEDAKALIEGSVVLFAKPRKRDKDSAVLLLCAGGYALIAVPGLVNLPGLVGLDGLRVVSVLSRGCPEYDRLKIKWERESTPDRLKEARAILDAVHAMEYPLTMHDRVVYIAGCLAKARQEGWSAAVQRSCDEVTDIWGADLVTTQEALEELLRCMPE